MARLPFWIVLSLALAALAGCAGVRTNTASTATPAPDPDGAAPAAAEAPPEAPPGDRPPEAQPGEAWCRVWQPPVHETRERRVCVRPAGRRTIRIPAEYGTRPKLVCVAPAKVKERVRPGVWKHEKRDVLVAPEREGFKRVRCCDDPCAECWVKETCPPVWREECRAVCIEPPTKRLEYTPAQYKTVEERFLIHPARCEVQCTPAEYETRSETVCVQPGRWVWRRNDVCEVPEEPLPALEVTMVDSDESGARKGVFKVGEVVRYDLLVRSDSGTKAVPRIRVTFRLPEQLEFISGAGRGVTITGQGREATSDVFVLQLEEEVEMHILARVVSVSPTGLVQTVSSVQTEDGEELSRHSESTTVTEPE